LHTNNSVSVDDVLDAESGLAAEMEVNAHLLDLHEFLVAPRHVASVQRDHGGDVVCKFTKHPWSDVTIFFSQRLKKLNLTECRPEVSSAPDGEEQHLASHLVLSGGGDARNSHAQVDSQFAQVASKIC